MIRLDASSYIVAAIGILVPVVYAVFVICHLSDETRKRVQQNGGLSMAGLQTALHSAFIKQEQEKTAPKPPADKKT
jgi:hypothetical protein